MTVMRPALRDARKSLASPHHSPSGHPSERTCFVFINIISAFGFDYVSLLCAIT